MAIRGMQRLQPAPNTRQPITMAILRVLHKQINFNSAHDRVLWGATVMGFFFLLRCGEYLLKNKRQYPFAIRRSDVVFFDVNGSICVTKTEAVRVQINFRGGKNDQGGVGAACSLGSSSTTWCCPVRAIWYLTEHHRKVSNNPDELLCKVDSSSFLHDRDIIKHIKAAAATAGYDPSRFSSHSLRIGGATALFAAGVDSLVIKQFGRWRSSVFETYTRIDSNTTEAMAQLMTGSPRPCLDCHHSHGLPPRHTRAGGGINTSSFAPHS